MQSTFVQAHFFMRVSWGGREWDQTELVVRSGAERAHYGRERG